MGTGHCVAALVACLVALPARAGEDTSARGTRGLHRVESARPLGAGVLTASVLSELSMASDLFVAGDENRRTAQHLVLAASPLEGLDLSGSWSLITNDNAAFDPQKAQYAGDPTLGAKYTLEVAEGLRLGADLRVLLPTSPKGTGLSPDAASFSGLLVASYAAAEWLDLALNGGYELDRSGRLFTRQINRAQRFTAGISEVDSVLLGAGAGAQAELSEVVALGGFLEVSGALASGAKTKDNPIWATGGMKALFLTGKNVELVIGADVRLSGKPREGADVPGLPPWQGFARLAGHIDFLREAQPALATACSADSDCSSGLVCSAGVCAVVREVTKEVVREVVKEKEVQPEGKTFVITGAVVDKQTSSAVARATITLSGFESTPLASDPHGRFRTFPLPVDGGLVQVKVEAPGYMPAEQTLPKGPAGSVKELTFQLVPVGQDIPGRVRGSVKDARSGKPVDATIFIPTLGLKEQAGKDGAFEIELKAGRYQVIISNSRHATQTKEVTISAGEVIILNIDMTPKTR